MNNIGLFGNVTEITPSKSNKGIKLKSLFEIRRPKKNRGLQRTNSLPAQPKPATLEKNEEFYANSTIPRNKINKVRPSSCYTDGPQNIMTEEGSILARLHSVTEENQRDCDLGRSVINNQPKYVSDDLEKSDTEYELICPTQINDNNEFWKIPNSHSSLDLVSNGSYEKFTCDMDNDANKYLHIPRVNSLFRLRNNNEEDVIRDGKWLNKHDNTDIENNYDTRSLPFWIHNKKSFIHTSTVDDELSPQISEKSLTLTSPKSNIHAELEDSPEEGANCEFEYSVDTLTLKKHRFTKNTDSRKSRNKVQRRRTGILMKEKSVRDLAHVFEGFRDANINGETENYRKSIVEEMDKENEQMLKDGFDDNLYLSMENLAIADANRDAEGEKTSLYSNDDKVTEDGNCNAEEEKKCIYSDDDKVAEVPEKLPIENNYDEIIIMGKNAFEDIDDMFGKMNFDEDIEGGSKFVEAYNVDGHELVICTLQLNRRSVDIENYNQLKSRSDLLATTEDFGEGQILISSSNDSGFENDSKRNTIYSTTSGDSYEEDTSARKQEDNDESCTSKRRETITDNMGVVRIERVNYYDKATDSESNQPHWNTTSNSIIENDEALDGENSFQYNQLEHQITLGGLIVKKTEIQYILEEILVTERKYVEDLGKVIEDYQDFLNTHYPDLVKVIFGNIEDIYQFQSSFLETLEKYGPQLNGITRAFIDYEMLFQLYPRYFRNTPKANAALKYLNDVIKTKQEELKNKLGISAYLVTPIQRLGKYALFFENIIKKLKKANKPIGEAEFALSIIKKYMRKGNDAVAIDSIVKSPIATKHYGAFIVNEKFTLLKPRRLELMVFLFEHVVVFAYEDQNDSEKFIYYKSINTNDLRIATFEDNTQLYLTDFEKEKRNDKSKHTFVLDAKNRKIRDLWKNEIEKILWNQLKKVKAKTIEAYSNQNVPKLLSRKDEKRKSSKSKTEPRRTKSIGNSIFY